MSETEIIAPIVTLVLPPVLAAIVAKYVTYDEREQLAILIKVARNDLYLPITCPVHDWHLGPVETVKILIHRPPNYNINRDELVIYSAVGDASYKPIIKLTFIALWDYITHIADTVKYTHIGRKPRKVLDRIQCAVCWD